MQLFSYSLSSLLSTRPALDAMIPDGFCRDRTARVCFGSLALRLAFPEGEDESGANVQTVLAVARRCSPSILARIMSLKHPGKCETKAV
jgi:hypothetical protein